ncbi:hypothetical protein CIC12_16775 [Burkholderia sp. SG-MS1]|nr:hypothetical protein [Paraburkholderia sp. SG-MS1]
MMEGLSAISRRFMRRTDKISCILFVAEYCTLGKCPTQEATVSGRLVTPAIERYKNDDCPDAYATFASSSEIETLRLTLSRVRG